MSEEMPKKEEEGVPGWIVTFADLMSLLLTFFVLLLSFAETDAQKFKEAAGSIKDAFGVQTDQLAFESMSSTTPFKTNFASGSREWEDFNFSQAQLSVPGDSFCQLEKQKKMRDKSNLEHIMGQLGNDLQQDIVQSNVKLFMDKNTLKVRLNMDKLFVKNSDKLKRSSVKFLKNVLKQIDEQKMGVSLKMTTYSSKKVGSKDFAKWKLSTQRQLVLTAIAKNERYRHVGNIRMESSYSEKSESTNWGVADMVLTVPE